MLRRREQRRGIRPAAGLLALSLLALAASPSGATASRAESAPAATALTRYPSVPASSVAKESHLQVMIGGRPVPLRNGGQIRLSRDLAVEAYLDPYPPNKLKAWLDLRLTRGQKARPMRRAVASVEYGMRYMYHGSFKALAKNLRNGHYLFTLSYLMYGGWDQLVTIRVGGRSYELGIVVVAVPG